MPELTPKQDAFIREYIANGGNGTKAAQVAYDTNSYNSAQSIASQNLDKPVIAEALIKTMRRAGITDEMIVKPVIEALTAVNADGTPNLDLQLKGHDRVMKMISKDSVNLSIGTDEAPQALVITFKDFSKKAQGESATAGE
jgi:phage terminase small subunit